MDVEPPPAKRLRRTDPTESIIPAPANRHLVHNDPKAKEEDELHDEGVRDFVLGGEGDLDPDAELALRQSQIDQKLKRTFEAIFERYGRSFDGEADEIDLRTGEVVVNNGHLSTMDDHSTDDDLESTSPQSDRVVNSIELGHYHVAGDPKETLQPAEMTQEGSEVADAWLQELMLEDDMILGGSYTERIESPQLIALKSPINHVRTMAKSAPEGASKPPGSRNRKTQENVAPVDMNHIEEAWRAPDLPNTPHAARINLTKRTGNYGLDKTHSSEPRIASDQSLQELNQSYQHDLDNTTGSTFDSQKDDSFQFPPSPVPGTVLENRSPSSQGEGKPPNTRERPLRLGLRKRANTSKDSLLVSWPKALQLLQSVDSLEHAALLADARVKKDADTPFATNTVEPENVTTNSGTGPIKIASSGFNIQGDAPNSGPEHTRSQKSEVASTPRPKLIKSCNSIHIRKSVTITPKQDADDFDELSLGTADVEAVLRVSTARKEATSLSRATNPNSLEHSAVLKRNHGGTVEQSSRRPQTSANRRQSCALRNRSPILMRTIERHSQDENQVTEQDQSSIRPRSTKKISFADRAISDPPPESQCMPTNAPGKHDSIIVGIPSKGQRAAKAAAAKQNQTARPSMQAPRKLSRPRRVQSMGAFTTRSKKSIAQTAAMDLSQEATLSNSGVTVDHDLMGSMPSLLVLVTPAKVRRDNSGPSLPNTSTTSCQSNKSVNSNQVPINFPVSLAKVDHEDCNKSFCFKCALR